MLNDHHLRRSCARIRAEHSAKGRNLSDRLEWAFERAVERPPPPVERRILSASIENRRRIPSNPTDATALIHEGEAPVPGDLKPAEFAAMTTVARAILNMHETITALTISVSRRTFLGRGIAGLGLLGLEFPTRTRSLRRRFHARRG